MQGQAYYELKQTGSAIQAFENAISAGGLLPNESSQLRLNIGQLLIGDGQYVRGAEMIENWGRSGGTITSNHVELLVQAWVSADRYSRALPWAERWFNEANPKERKHFDLLNFLYNNLGQPAKQADIVKTMINRWPEDRGLWEAWASLLDNGGRSEEAFEVNKMLYLGGALNTESDILQGVSIKIRNGLYSSLTFTAKRGNMKKRFLFLKPLRSRQGMQSNMLISVKPFIMKVNASKQRQL